MDYQTIAARQVVVGDEIYNKSATRPEFKWTRVIKTRYSDDQKSVILTTMAWETWKHPEEGVAVRCMPTHLIN